MIGVGAPPLTSIQFGYWAILVYLPLFLSAGLHVSMEAAGVMLLAATLPMLLVPPLGGRLVTQWGWRRFFAVAFGVVASGNVLLVIAALPRRSCDAQHRNAGRHADDRCWRGVGQPAIGKRRSWSCAARAGRHDVRNDDDRPSGRFRHQHRRVGGQRS